MRGIASSLFILVHLLAVPSTSFAPSLTRPLVTPSFAIRPSHPRQALKLFARRPSQHSAHSVEVDVSEETKPESEVTNKFEIDLSRHQTSEMNYEEIGMKIFNGLILAVSFGYAAYTILNIDHGMTRGWTQSEIAMRIPLDNWQSYETSLAEKPIYTKTLINVVIYLLGDWLSQTAFQKKHMLDFDPWRVLRNGFIGLCFGPLVHEYYQFSDHILPVDGGLLIRLQKILMDQTIYLTVKCSIYIMSVGLLAGESFATVKNNVKERISGIVFTAWKFWPLVHCITYGVIPARHRILWVNCVDLIWNAILATMASRKLGTEEENTVAAALAEQEVKDPFVLVQELVPASIEKELLFDDSNPIELTDLVPPPMGNSTVAVA